MQIRFGLPIKEEPGMIVCELVLFLKTISLLGGQPPEVQILFGPGQFSRCAAASGVGEGEQVQQCRLLTRPR